MSPQKILTAKNGWWTLICPCRASFRITGEAILQKISLECPNCGKETPLTHLKEAVKHLFAFHRALSEASEPPGHWRLQPPGFTTA